MDVLVIEDDPDAREGLVRVFTRAGFAVTAVDDGLAALAQVRERAFDAIVLDLRLPYLPGGGFYEQLAHEAPALAHRVLFVTGIAHDPAVREFLESTGRPYFAKPYDARELIEAVRRVAA